MGQISKLKCMERIIEYLKPVAIASAFLTFLTAMFMEEIRTLFFSNWRTICFLISALLMIFALSLYIMEFFCKQLLKSKFSNIIDQNKELSTLNNLYLNNLIIDHFIINEVIIDKMNDDELLELCIEVYKKFGTPIVDKRKEKIPNFKDYGIRENVLKRFEILYRKEEIKRLKNELDSNK